MAAPDQTPPRPARPLKRPWYLMAALVATWFYGAQILEGGYEILAFVRGDRPDIHQLTDSIASAEIRDAAYAAGEQWIAVTEAAERRQLPFGAASLLLGAAMVLLAARSMAGRDGSRRALVQVVAVHAGVLVAGFLLNQDVARAESAFQLRRAQGGNPAMTSTLVDPVARQGAEVGTRILEHALAPIGILMQTAVSSLIVIALTRPRARAFFREAASGPLGEG